MRHTCRPAGSHLCRARRQAFTWSTSASAYNYKGVWMGGVITRRHESSVCISSRLWRLLAKWTYQSKLTCPSKQRLLTGAWMSGVVGWFKVRCLRRSLQRRTRSEVRPRQSRA